MTTLNWARPVVLVAMMVLSVARHGAAQAAAPAKEIDPKFRAEIARLLDATGAANIGTQMADLVIQQLSDSMRKARPNPPARALELVSEVVKGELAKAFTDPAGLRARLIDLYAKHFTPDDVSALATFYESPVGRRATAQQLTLTRETANVAREWAQAQAPQIMKTLQERFKQEGIQ